MSNQGQQEKNQDATCYVGDLAPQVTEEIMWELFLQCGPVVNVYIPRDKLTQAHSGFGFVEFRSVEDAEYAIKIMNAINLFQRPIRVNRSSRDKQDLDVGANLFIGNLHDDVDEKLLYDTFSRFGRLIQPPKVMREPDSGVGRGFGFVKFDSFEASDSAIEMMNGQYLCNKAINVTYMYKKDSRERHGDEAERLLASKQKQQQMGSNYPHQFFGSVPLSAVSAPATALSVPPSLPPPAAAGGAPPVPPPMFAVPPPPGMVSITPPSFPLPEPTRPH